ncbi:glycoside hydrolase family 3 N-terminal domain-containing protein, partial [Kitasatospora nipponensis]|uniref:glycoside hydrolase family 3 N-terminal domain-containing protein n=1 Tax=Kitasatospora nipponensis TaxID=258049 RepID=UPI003CD07D1A
PRSAVPPASTRPPAATAAPRPTTAPSPGSAAATVPLTAEQLAGQRVVYSYPGLTPPPSLLEDVRAGRAAGVIFFGQNTSDPVLFRAAVAQLREAQRQSPVRAPLLLMTDQEGGLVRRLPGAPDLSARQVGQAADPVLAAALAGTGAGRNLADYGLNVNLAPVLDVYAQSGDFIDHSQRSFGSDPAAVTALGSAFITAQQQTGVAATAKHFPGLGTAPAGANTDEGPVTLDAPASRLTGTDEAPYPAAIAAGVRLVMVSWAVYPTLDAAHPAGLSTAVVRGLLRGQLGFRGVTITDALEAGAVQAAGGTGERAVDAAAAGMDLLLCSAQDSAQGEAATTALATALTAGRLDRADFAAAAERVTALRATLH